MEDPPILQQPVPPTSAAINLETAADTDNTEIDTDTTPDQVAGDRSSSTQQLPPETSSAQLHVDDTTRIPDPLSQILLTPLQEIGHISFPSPSVTSVNLEEASAQPVRAPLYALASSTTRLPSPGPSTTSFSWPNSISFNGIQGTPNFGCTNGTAPFGSFPAFLYSPVLELQSLSLLPDSRTELLGRKRTISEAGLFDSEEQDEDDADVVRRPRLDPAEENAEEEDEEENNEDEVEGEQEEEAEEEEDAEVEAANAEENKDINLYIVVNVGSNDSLHEAQAVTSATATAADPSTPVSPAVTAPVAEEPAPAAPPETAQTPNERLLQALREALSQPVLDAEGEYEEYEPMEEDDENADEEDEEEPEATRPATLNNSGCLALVEDVILSYGKISSTRKDKIDACLVGDAIRVIVGGFLLSASYVTRDTCRAGYSLGFYLDDLEPNSFILQLQDGIMRVRGQRGRVDLCLRIEIAAPVRIEDVSVSHNVATNVVWVEVFF